MRILYAIIDGQISGGNNVCATVIKEALNQELQIEVLTPTLGELTDLFIKQGIKVHTIQLDRSFYFHKSVQLAALLKKQKIDLVHTHTSLFSEILCRIACFLAGIPIICHQHDPTDFYNQNYLIAIYQRWLDRITSNLVTKFVAVSENRQKVMELERGYPADKIQLIHNGINIERFSCQDNRGLVRKQWSLQSQDIAIGLIARIEDPKGHGTFIEAIPLVLKNYPQTKFFIIGDDRWPNQPYLTKYRQRVKELSIQKNIHFLGFSSKIHQLIQGLDIITLPSWWEGHPLILLESLAAQKPVIASDVGGVPEIVIHEQTGLLIPARTPQALANAICYLITEPKLREKLAKNGYQRVKQFFDKKQMLAQTLSLYNKIIAQSK